VNQTPRYVVDYESIAHGHSDPLLVIEELVDRVGDRPDFWRGPYCRGCEHWDGKDRPARPFADNPLGPAGGCAGCVLSHLDVNPEWLAEHAEEIRRRSQAGRRRALPEVGVARYERGRLVREEAS